MNFVETELPAVVIVEPKVFIDERGLFMETFHAQKFQEAGLPTSFAQDNHSSSVKHTLRGIHFQLMRPQGKLVRVVAGEIFDVAVDMRRSSPTFGKWTGVTLSADNRRQLWIPEGFAHGFLTTSARAEVVYKCTSVYDPASERTLRWDDATVGSWRGRFGGAAPLLSAKDAAGLTLAQSEAFA